MVPILNNKNVANASGQTSTYMYVYIYIDMYIPETPNIHELMKIVVYVLKDSRNHGRPCLDFCFKLPGMRLDISPPNQGGNNMDIVYVCV